MQITENVPPVLYAAPGVCVWRKTAINGARSIGNPYFRFETSCAMIGPVEIDDDFASFILGFKSVK